MQNIKEALGANLRKIRKSRKLTIDNLAYIADITPRLLSKIEAGDTFISAETLCKISVALDVGLQVLFDFDWYDNVMYFDNEKYIKPHFRSIQKNKIYQLKSLPALKDHKIIKTMEIGELTRFLMDFSKKNNMEIYTECFIDKKRDKIVKYKPDGTFSFIATSTEITNKKTDMKDIYYYKVLDKLKIFSVDKAKVSYVDTAMEALSSKKARDKLRIMLDAMDISK